MMDICAHIKQILAKELKDAIIMVLDPQQDQTHLEAVVVSDEFVEMPLVQQHRRIMKILKTSFENELHALKLKTLTHEQWEQTNKGAV